MAMVTFSAGQVASPSDVNSNFANCVACDTARTVTVTHSWTASQTFTGGWTAGAACTVSTGGLTVTAGGLTVTAGGLTVTAGALTMGTASSRIIPGVTDFAINDHANANNNFLLTDAGVATIRAGLTVTSGGMTVTAGGLTVSAGTSAVQALTATTGTFSGLLVGNAGLSTTTGAFTSTITISAAASKIVPGATSLSFRNNADSADNLKITDAGAATVRAGLTVTTGGVTITGNSTITGTLTSLTGITSSGTAALGTVTASATVTAATGITCTVGPINIGSGSGYQYGGTTVVGSRKTGWSSQTISPGSRGDMGLTPTTQVVANTLAALITDLTSHGLIGA